MELIRIKGRPIRPGKARAVRMAGGIPASLQRYASRIADYSDERALDSGIHISYVRGWKSFTDPIGIVHGDVVDTVAEALGHIRAAMPCDCEDCKK